ncbi:MAG: mannose-6-phosphate isomerase, class I [Kineosporiaceae bacterium]
MVNPIHHYEWGSRTALAWIQGREPSGRPEAELWMGAHPLAPSRLIAADGTEHDLDALVTDSPIETLGARASSRFDGRLPFLLKVLAFDQPLSVQVHPDAAHARRAWEAQQERTATAPADAAASSEAGSEAEVGTGTGVEARNGSGHTTDPHYYSDPYAKPEMLYALQPIDAMCGFRSAERARELVELLDCDRLSELAADLTSEEASEEDRLRRAFARLLHWPAEDRAGLAADLGKRARVLLATAGGRGTGPSATDRRALTWCSRLSRLYPEDPLVAAPLLLDLFRLDPGDTLFVPAGAPHAYLYGLGVEIMANTDNVLRAGLTHKPVAVDELLQVVDSATRPVRQLPQVQLGPFEVTWRLPVDEFRLTRLRLPHDVPVSAWPYLSGPQVLLCSAGTVTVHVGGRTEVLTPGESVFLGAGGGPLSVNGPGELFRAATGA